MSAKIASRQKNTRREWYLRLNLLSLLQLQFTGNRQVLSLYRTSGFLSYSLLISMNPQNHLISMSKRKLLSMIGGDNCKKIPSPLSTGGTIKWTRVLRKSRKRTFKPLKLSRDKRLKIRTQNLLRRAVHIDFVTLINTTPSKKEQNRQRKLLNTCIYLNNFALSKIRQAVKSFATGNVPGTVPSELVSVHVL